MEIVGSLIMKRTFLQKLPLLGMMLPGSNHMKVASPLVWAVAACVVDPSYQSRHGPGLGSWVHVHVQGSSKKTASGIREFCSPKWDDFNKHNCKKVAVQALKAPKSENMFQIGFFQFPLQRTLIL